MLNLYICRWLRDCIHVGNVLGGGLELIKLGRFQSFPFYVLDQGGQAGKLLSLQFYYHLGATASTTPYVANSMLYVDFKPCAGEIMLNIQFAIDRHSTSCEAFRRSYCVRVSLSL